MPITQVTTRPAIGIPGAKADMNDFDYYPQSLVAESDIDIGSFVWLGTNKEVQASYAQKGETFSPIGFVERNIVYPQLAFDQEATSTVPKGSSLTIATRGSFYAVSTTDAVAGQDVFAFLSNGYIATAEEGSQVTDAVSTGWKVITGGKANEIIIIKRG